MAIDLIVGLGNPGKKYQGTRHNVGADFARAVGHHSGAPFSQETKLGGLCAKADFNGNSLLIFIPNTFMNQSGNSVAAVCRYYRINLHNMLIAHDELDLPVGTARFKLGGGHGGHKGLSHIMSSLSNNRHFARLRIGIGHPGQASQVTGYVLERPNAIDRNLIDSSIQRALTELHHAVASNWQLAMQQLHSPP